MAKQPPHPHPTSHPMLPLLMVVTLLAGVAFVTAGREHGVMLGAFCFAWFLAAFLLYVHGWTLREHELWRADRTDRR